MDGREIAVHETFYHIINYNFLEIWPSENSKMQKYLGFYDFETSHIYILTYHMHIFEIRVYNVI